MGIRSHIFKLLQTGLGVTGFCLFVGHSLWSQEVPFSRGVNLTNWFQAGSAHQIQLGKYTKEDFIRIQSLGFDVIRLPINLHAMTSGAPNYRLEPLFLEFLDQAVDWAEDLQMYLILDNHTFDPAAATDPNIGPILEKVWAQMAQYYHARSEYVIYEVLNEPHDISDQLWNNIQMQVVDAIRAIDQDHYIVIGPAGWNSFHNLNDMPVYPQEKLIYTFHFYDPFIFTHQGATWTNPSMGPLAEVPFPYDAARMPIFPASLTGTWIESAFNNYLNEGTISQLQSMIDIAVQFRESRKVPVFCGEFGAYIPNSNQDDRVLYYQEVREYLEARNIPWTTWDYHGGFGLYQAGGNGLFDHDLNVELLAALGLVIPPQTPFVKQPQTAGFPIYTDQIGHSLQESSTSGSQINYYSEDSPNNGKYCLKWEDGEQYQYIGLDLRPNMDLSQLAAQGYALDFMFRATEPIAFDIRFLDTDTGAEDHPWRMRYTIDEQAVPFDRRWHHLHIPLSHFFEHGAWENGQWFSPQGKFDWTDIDRIQIVAEHENMGNTTLWFDNLYVTNLDTARVQDQSVFEDLVTSLEDPELDETVKVYPNPAQNQLTIAIVRPHSNTNSHYKLYNNVGKVIKEASFVEEATVGIVDVIPGVYYLEVIDNKDRPLVTRVVKL